MKILDFESVVVGGGNGVSWIELLDSVVVLGGGNLSVTGGARFLLGTQPPPFPIERENWGM
jgi:hypothetical protein